MTADETFTKPRLTSNVVHGDYYGSQQLPRVAKGTFPKLLIRTDAWEIFTLSVSPKSNI